MVAHYKLLYCIKIMTAAAIFTLLVNHNQHECDDCDVSSVQSYQQPQHRAMNAIHWRFCIG